MHSLVEKADNFNSEKVEGDTPADSRGFKNVEANVTGGFSILGPLFDDLNKDEVQFYTSKISFDEKSTHTNVTMTSESDEAWRQAQAAKKKKSKAKDDCNGGYWKTRCKFAPSKSGIFSQKEYELYGKSEDTEFQSQALSQSEMDLSFQKGMPLPISIKNKPPSNIPHSIQNIPAQSTINIVVEASGGSMNIGSSGYGIQETGVSILQAIQGQDLNVMAFQRQETDMIGQVRNPLGGESPQNSDRQETGGYTEMNFDVMAFERQETSMGGGIPHMPGGPAQNMAMKGTMADSGVGGLAGKGNVVGTMARKGTMADGGSMIRMGAMGENSFGRMDTKGQDFMQLNTKGDDKGGVAGGGFEGMDSKVKPKVSRRVVGSYMRLDTTGGDSNMDRIDILGEENEEDEEGKMCSGSFGDLVSFF
jgi:hypothetical protein